MNFSSIKNKKVLKIAGWTVGVLVVLFVIGSIGNTKSQTPEVLSDTNSTNQSVSGVGDNSQSATTVATTTKVENAVSPSQVSIAKTNSSPPKSSATAATVSSKVGPSEIYPNPNLTTGDVFPVDAKTVCVSGYTATVRDVPLSVRKQVYAEYGVSYPQPTGMYEVDHFIPLELGGSNDIKNLFLEPASTNPVGFHQKDVYENYAHKQVCNGEITLQEAQERMRTDWYKYYLLATNKTTTTTTASVVATSTPASNSSSVSQTTNVEGPAVKKSTSGICHAQGTQYYDRTTNYKPYNSIDACLASGGRLPK